MWIYIARRVLLLVPVLLGVLTITFILISAVPTQQRLVSAFGSPKSGTGQYISCPGGGPVLCVNPWWTHGIHTLGLDQPVPVQWAKYMYNAFTLQWGYTSSSSYLVQAGIPGGTPITQILSWYLPYTLELAAFSLFFILILAIPVGNRAAVYRNRPFDQGARILSFSGFALPNFLLASVALLAFVVLSGGFVSICGGHASPLDLWFGLPPSLPGYACPPYSGSPPHWIGSLQETSPTHFITIDALINGQPLIALDSIRRLFLPALTIAYASVAGILRFVRNSMLEVMNLDYIRTARAKGVPEAVVISKHAGRNSLNVTVTVLGLTFAFFIVGFPVTELIFNLRGIGLLFTYSILQPFDFGTIFGTTVVFSIIVVLANIIVDIVYAYLDPRVRLG
ncbi:MAG: ABC transporter permease [Thermoplasmata archaeon]|nr:ABC transporter permease [Thermoplasmata archaeon]